MKLAYLHPNWFKPNVEIIGNLIETTYFIIRLSSLSAHHDIGIKGINLEILREIIRKLSNKGKVYITSEVPLGKEFEHLRLKNTISDIHHYLYYAQALICDSQSMAGEAAMLGTPSIRISSFVGKLSVLEELEHKYQLTFGIKPNEPDKLFNKIDELLAMSHLKDDFQNRRHKMLADKIDVTAFIEWFIENYPKSIHVMKENPDYQYNFK
jgi:predicted glycosyltransferase